MRKDVKIGLAIGGIVLAVLIVYVLKVPSEQNKEAQSEPQKVAQTEPDIAMVPSTQPAQVAIGGATTQPVSMGVDPFAARPTTMPSADAYSSTPTSGDKADWGTALSTGRMSLSASGARGDVIPVGTAHAGSGNGGAAGNVVDPAIPAGGSRTHTVQKGETLSSIAQMAYGNANLYPVIVKANPKVNPSKVRPGTVLVLPEPSSVAHSATAAGSSAASSAAALDSKHYRVLPGDSLQKIAVKLYGASDKWEKIYDLNKSKIGSDPQKIKAEMVLALPDEPAVH